MPLTQEEEAEMMEAEQAAYDQALIAEYEREQWLLSLAEQPELECRDRALRISPFARSCALACCVTADLVFEHNTYFVRHVRLG